MEKHEVKIGNVYMTKVNRKLAPVRIIAEGDHGGGWIGVNTKTNRRVHIKSASRLSAQVRTQDQTDMPGTVYGEISADIRARTFGI